MRPIRTIVYWLEDRTGIESAVKNFLYEDIPASAGWHQIIGSMAVFFFVIQVFTGAMLAFNYAPTPGEAYNSVKYIMTELTAGPLIRGLHHWGASMMLIIVVLHMIQVFIYGAYKKPREATWMVGVTLLLITLAFGLTGYLLPWGQPRVFWHRGHHPDRIASTHRGAVSVALARQPGRQRGKRYILAILRAAHRAAAALDDHPHRDSHLPGAQARSRRRAGRHGAQAQVFPRAGVSRTRSAWRSHSLFCSPWPSSPKSRWNVWPIPPTPPTSRGRNGIFCSSSRRSSSSRGLWKWSGAWCCRASRCLRCS